MVRCDFSLHERFGRSIQLLDEAATDIPERAQVFTAQDLQHKPHTFLHITLWDMDFEELVLDRLGMNESQAASGDISRYDLNRITDRLKGGVRLNFARSLQRGDEHLI